MVNSAMHTVPTTLPSETATRPRLSVLWPIACAAALLYGSLIPFDINWAAFATLLPGGLLGLGLESTSIEDVILNVLLYVPIGLLVVLSGAASMGSTGVRRRPIRAATVRERTGASNRHDGTPFRNSSGSVSGLALNEIGRNTTSSYAWRVFLAVLVGAAVSLVAENLQAGAAMRVASWLDVALNTFGALTGAIVAVALRGVGARSVRSLQIGYVRRPFTILSIGVTVGLLFYGLAPFDFVTSTHGLHASFLTARWSLTLAPSDGAHTLAALAGELVGASWFALLGCLCALSRREARRSTLAAWLGALKSGLLLAVLVEIMQLFVTSHCFELLSLVLRSAAVFFGAWCGAFLIGESFGARLRDRPIAFIPGPAWALLVFVQLVALVGSAMGAAWPTLARLDLSTVRWMPFEALWHRSALAAASTGLEVVVTYAALGLAVAGLLRYLRLVPIWPLTGLAVAIFAVGVEALELVTGGGTPDITGPVLALASVLFLAQLSVLWPSSPTPQPVTA